MELEKLNKVFSRLFEDTLRLEEELEFAGYGQKYE
jgi:hypothetical protein